MAHRHSQGMSVSTRVTAAKKRKAALEARLAGASYETVALTCGYASEGAAHNAVMAALHDIPKAKAEQLRQLEAERLDAMHLALWGRALRGDTQAVSGCLAILEKRARLFGLNIEAEGTPPMIIQKAYIGVPLEHFLSAGTDDADPQTYIEGSATEVKR